MQRCLVIGARGERRLLNLFQRPRQSGRIECTGDVEAGRRLLDTQKQLELVARLNQIQPGGVIVRFEFRQLQVDAIEIGRADISGVEARLAQLDGLTVTIEVIVGDLESQL